MYLIKNYILTNNLNSICEHTYIRLYNISRNRLPRDKFEKLLYLIKNNPITITENLLIKFRSLIDSLENNEKNKVQIESAIKEWVKNRDEKMISIPGVGHILCATILATTGDIKNFSTFNKFYAYTGLYPKRYQTGKHTQIDKVAKEGSKLLRQTLYKCMGTIRANNKPWDYIYRLKKEKLSLKYTNHNYTKVVNGHIIKRVLKAVYYCTKNDTDFDPQKAYASSMIPKNMLNQV